MKTTLRRTLLRAAFTLSVAIAGLTVAPHALPAAQAASPSLTATAQGGVSWSVARASPPMSRCGWCCSTAA
jgi:hypothetical protein